MSLSLKFLSNRLLFFTFREEFEKLSLICYFCAPPFSVRRKSRGVSACGLEGVGRNSFSFPMLLMWSLCLAFQSDVFIVLIEYHRAIRIGSRGTYPVACFVDVNPENGAVQVHPA